MQIHQALKTIRAEKTIQTKKPWSVEDRFAEFQHGIALLTAAQIVDVDNSAFTLARDIENESDLARQCLEGFFRKLAPPSTTAALFVALAINPFMGLALVKSLGFFAQDTPGSSQADVDTYNSVAGFMNDFLEHLAEWTSITQGGMNELISDVLAKNRNGQYSAFANARLSEMLANAMMSEVLIPTGALVDEGNGLYTIDVELIRSVHPIALMGVH